MSDIDLLRLLIRNIPFVLARPDIGVSPAPGDKTIEARHDFGLGGRTALSFSFGVATLGGFARLWENLPGPSCPSCGTRSALVDFGGSFLSGAGRFARWLCPSCASAFTTRPEGTVVGFGGRVEDASRRDGPVLPFADAGERMLPKGTSPRDLRRVFHGRLVDAYATAAVEEVAAFDAMVREAVGAGRAFPATFRLRGGRAEGEVCFSNINGHAMLYGDFEGSRGAPVEWNESWGLMPMLRRLGERLRTPAEEAEKGPESNIH